SPGLTVGNHHIREPDISYSYVPVPESDTFWVTPPPLSLTYNVPVRVPVRLGLDVTETSQVAPGPSSEAHVVVREKSPTTLIPEIFIFVGPVFIIVTLSGSLSLPTGVGGKLSCEG